MAQRKILIITNRIPYPMKDGGNIAMKAMIDGYHNAGWQVFLLAMNTTRHHVKEDVLRRIYTHLHAFEWMNIDNTVKWNDVVRNFLFGKQPEHAERFYDLDFKAKIKSVLQAFKPDVVQIESVYLSTYLPAIKKYSDASTILRMHNVEYQIWQGLARRTKNFLKKLYLKNLTVRVRNFERAAWKEYDLLLPITEKDAPFSIERDRVIGKHPAEKWVGYHLGAMDWLPNKIGMRWFIRKAWPLIHRTAPKFEFYFAGRHMPPEFRGLDISGVHCEDEVHDADEFISDKKILIVPIFSGGGIRVKILEAMAAGKVVVTTATGIKGIEAKPGEHYLRAQTPDDFAKAVKWVLEHKDEAEKIADNARNLVIEKYEHGKVMGKVIDRVESIISSALV
jgi:hypothetical protein